MGKADFFPERPIKDGCAQSPRLGNKGDMPFKGHGSRKTGIELEARRYYSQTVGSNDTHTRVVFFVGKNFFFESPAFLTGLAKTGGNNNDTQNAGLSTFFN